MIYLLTQTKIAYENKIIFHAKKTNQDIDTFTLYMLEPCILVCIFSIRRASPPMFSM
jgi:hypothetical protein